MNKLQILKEKLKDDRSRKVVFVAHCILNENVRYLGGAFRKGCVDEIIDELQKQGIGIVQMPCPEQKCWGGVLKKDAMRGFDSNGTLLYKIRKIYIPFFIWNTKRKYKKTAKNVAMEINDYIDSGFEVIGIIGLSPSPSCGVNTTLDIKKFIEFMTNIDMRDLNREKMNELGIKNCLINGKGFFIEVLEQELRKRNIKIKFHEHNLILEMNGKDIKLKL